MAGGSQIIINKNGITFITPGKFEAKAGQHLFKGGATITTQLPIIPDVENPYILQYLVQNKENEAIANKPYILMDDEGNIQQGVTNKDGLMKLKTSPSAKTLMTRVMMNEIEEAEEEETDEE